MLVDRNRRLTKLIDAMFKIANHAFSMKTAYLEPFYADDEDVLCWGVFCVAVGGDTLGGQDPCINFDRLLETRPGQLASWKDLAGTKLEWVDPAGGPEGQFIVWEGEDIRDCHWEFARGKPGELILRINGITDICGDAPFDRNVPFEIETSLAIHPWPMGEKKQSACLRIYRHLGLQDPVDFRRIDGVSYLLFT
jgi:hypothetical protein